MTRTLNILGLLCLLLLGAIGGAGAQSFSRWQAALARVKAGTGDARILCVGDSTTSGVGSSQTSTTPYRSGYPALLGAQIQSAGYAVSNAAIAPPHTAGNNNTEWASVAGFSEDGLGFLTCREDSTVGDSMTYSPLTLSNTYNVYYVQVGSSGTITAQVTGGSMATINTAGTTGIGKTTITAAATSTSNVVTITHTAGGTVYLVGIEPYRSSLNQVLIANVGVGASVAISWGHASGGFYPVDTIKAYHPDLTIIMLGINDAATNTSASSVQSAIQNVITAAKVSGDVIVMTVVPSTGGSYYAAEQGYYLFYVALANSNSVGYADVWSAFGKSYNATFMSDSLHPNDSGYSKIANLLYPVVLPPVLPPALFRHFGTGISRKQGHVIQ